VVRFDEWLLENNGDQLALPCGLVTAMTGMGIKATYLHRRLFKPCLCSASLSSCHGLDSKYRQLGGLFKFFPQLPIIKLLLLERLDKATSESPVLCGVSKSV